TTRRTGRNGAAPAAAESIIESMRSVFARIAWRSIGFVMSVWQQATEYLMCSMIQRSFRFQVSGSKVSRLKVPSNLKLETWNLKLEVAVPAKSRFAYCISRNIFAARLSTDNAQSTDKDNGSFHETAAAQ